jgi:uncharacterized protein YprB with RNaseH-like and TPR domain
MAAPQTIRGNDMHAEMKVQCPFCSAAGRITYAHLDAKLKCPTCTRAFVCSIDVRPAYGTMFLDIETTGAPWQSHTKISSIVWWCDGEWHHWIRGQVGSSDLIQFWENSEKLVTFNGISFDEKYIREEFV